MTTKKTNANVKIDEAVTGTYISCLHVCDFHTLSNVTIYKNLPFETVPNESAVQTKRILNTSRRKSLARAHDRIYKVKLDGRALVDRYVK